MFRALFLVALFATAWCQIYQKASTIQLLASPNAQGIFHEEETGLVVFVDNSEILTINNTSGEKTTYNLGHSPLAPFLVTHHVFYFVRNFTTTKYNMNVFCLKEKAIKKSLELDELKDWPSSAIFDPTSSTVLLRVREDDSKKQSIALYFNIKTLKFGQITLPGSSVSSYGTEVVYDAKRRTAYTYSHKFDQSDLFITAVQFNEFGPVSEVKHKYHYALRPAVVNMAYNPNDSNLYISHVYHGKGKYSTMFRLSTEPEMSNIDASVNYSVMGVMVDKRTNQVYFSSEQGMLMPNKEFKTFTLYPVYNMTFFAGSGVVVYKDDKPNAYVVDYSMKAVVLTL